MKIIGTKDLVILISSGKAKFSMASCKTYVVHVNTCETFPAQLQGRVSPATIGEIETGNYSLTGFLS